MTVVAAQDNMDELSSELETRNGGAASGSSGNEMAIPQAPIAEVEPDGPPARGLMGCACFGGGKQRRCAVVFATRRYDGSVDVRAPLEDRTHGVDVARAARRKQRVS